MNPLENVKVALGSIRDNFLRSLLTLLIIAVGISCLVGMLTAIDGIYYSMNNNFNRMGANSFTVRRANETIKSSKRKKVSENILFDQATEYKDKFHYAGAVVSINTWCTGSAEAKYRDKKTNPTTRLVGIDENYFTTSSYEMKEGRNFSINEISSGNNKAIIGKDIVKDLFGGKDKKAIGQVILVDNNRYKVIGTLDQKGSSSGGSNDRRIFIPLLNAKKIYGYPTKHYEITTSIKNPVAIDDAVSSAIGRMRVVRNLKASEANDFTIRKSDGILSQLKEMTSSLRIGTIVIAGLTLLGAAIGLMNIMLVTVTERTKEIGVRKALGATSENILFQFMIEAIVICIIGGLVGIAFGILLGLGVTKLIDGVFVVPWDWMLLGIIVCVVVGLVSGLYPALKASRMDPIESLRYE